MNIRKGIERIFSVLQGLFKKLGLEMYELSDGMVVLISEVCVILHNTIVEMKWRGELDEEIGEKIHFVDVVNEFLHTIVL